MNGDPNALPLPDDDGPEADPVDVELIAYLDGELEPAAARRVEARIASDSRLRARAAALKRSYDLLDFLPKPEPSPAFATRTLDKLPPVKASSSHATPVPHGAGSSSLPAILSNGSSSLAFPYTTSPSAPRRTWVWAAAALVAVGIALAAGYLGAAAARSYFFHPSTAKDPGVDNLPLADLRVLENLPLYAGVDDLGFLTALGGAEFFGDEAAPPEGLPLHSVEADKPSGKQLDDLLKAFRELPPDRQEKIRKLDSQIHEQEPPKRDRSIRILEAYAAWLQRLGEADRRDVFAAPTAEKRLEAIREVQKKQWIESLPQAQRHKLKALPAAEKADLLAKWKAEQEKSHDAWFTARAQWEAARTGRSWWPFTDDKLKPDVVAYVDAVYHPDDPRLNRLPDTGDRDRLKEALDHGAKGDWFLLGKTVYDFSKRYEMLPEPGAGKLVLDIPDLIPWDSAHKHYVIRPKARQKIDGAIGKWPEFALAVSADATLGANKILAPPANFRLGPCRPDEFKDEVKRFLPELKKKAGETEWSGLRALEGQWPAYPRELIRLAKSYDLSVPGAMPPGPPSRWEKTYNPPRPPLLRPGG